MYPGELPKALCYCLQECDLSGRSSELKPDLLFLTQQLNSQHLPAITAVVAYRQRLFQMKEHSLKFPLNAHYCFADILGAVIVPVSELSLYLKPQPSAAARVDSGEHVCLQCVVLCGYVLGEFTRKLP